MENQQKENDFTTSQSNKLRDFIESKERSHKRKELALQIQHLRQRVDRLNDKMDNFLACMRSRANNKSPSPTPTNNRLDST